MATSYQPEDDLGDEMGKSPARTLEFSDYPPLSALLHNHTPGFDYLIGLATNVAKFHAGGWRQVINRSPFLIRGEAFLLFRKGAPVWGGNPGDCTPHLFIDVDADRKLGIATPGRVEGPKAGEPGEQLTLPFPEGASNGGGKRTRPVGVADPSTRPTLKMPVTAPTTTTPKEG